jgi:glycosyltransferase involved in cell wall biosynthesis
MPTTQPRTLRRSAHRPRVALISVHGDPLVPVGAEEAGGQNVYVREVARALGARGLAVDVFTRGRDCAHPEIVRLDDARVIRRPAGARGFVSRNALFAHLPEFTEHVRRFVDAEGDGYDIIHSNYWLSGWVGHTLSREWHRPQLHTHHSLGAVKYAATGDIPDAGRARLKVEAMLLGQCAGIVATSPEDVASMRRHYPASPRTTIIPCGIDPAAFRPRSQRASRMTLGLPMDRPVVAYVGRFDPA